MRSHRHIIVRELLTYCKRTGTGFVLIYQNHSVYYTDGIANVLRSGAKCGFLKLQKHDDTRIDINYNINMDVDWLMLTPAQSLQNLFSWPPYYVAHL